MDLTSVLDKVWNYLGVSGYVIAFSLVLSIIDWITQGLLSALFAYNIKRTFIHGEVQRFVLSPFLHANFAHFQGNMISFAIFGPLIERRIGLEEYLMLFLLGHLGSIIVSSLIEIWSNTFSVGLSGVIYAFQTAYFILVFNNPTSFWEKIAGYLGVLWIIQDLWRSFWSGIFRSQHDNIDHWGHLGGILSGIFYVRFFT